MRRIEDSYLEYLAARLRSTSGGPAPGTPAYNPTWYAATNVYWDPLNGSDSNSGTVIGSPVLTWAEIVRRYGSTSPQFSYGQSVTFHQLTAQPAGQDPIFFEPMLSGGGQAILTVTLASAGANFSAGTLGGGFGFAGATPTAGGTPMTMANVPSYAVKNTLLHNTNRSSYAFVDSVSGTTATLCQPILNATQTSSIQEPNPDNDWVTGDTIEAWTCQLSNLKLWSPIGGDWTTSSVTCAGFVFFARIADTSGIKDSLYNHACQAAQNVLSCCQIDGSLAVENIGGRRVAGSLWNCVIAGLSTIRSDLVTLGGSMTRVSVWGTSSNFLGNSILHGQIILAGDNGALTSVYSDGQIFVLANVSASGTVFGSYTMTVYPGGVYLNASGSTFALSALLTTGAIKFGSATTTGSAYAGSGVYVDGITLTPAHIDTGGAGGPGLFDPLSGARFCNV